MGVRRIPGSASVLLALTALVLALSGAAVALPGKNTVSADDIKKNAVRSKEIDGKSVKAGDVADNTLTTKQVKAESLTPADISGLSISDESLIRVAAHESAGGIAAARAAAPETILYEDDGLSVYAKCYRDSLAGATEGAIFGRTNDDGALLAGEAAGLPNDDAAPLNQGTPEVARQIGAESVNVPNAADFGVADGALADADGTSFRLLTTIGAKQGSFSGDDAFGSGNACVFALTVVG